MLPERIATKTSCRDPVPYAGIMKSTVRTAALGICLALLPLSLLAPAAEAAAPADRIVMLTRAELREAGFPRRPNVTNWGNGTAKVTPHRAAIGEAITITGTAPKSVKPGTVLTLQRFLPTNRKGDGSFQDLELVTTTVDANRKFTMVARLSRPGLWGYRVGFLTDGQNPEFVGFQFQARTTTATADTGTTDS